MRDRVIEKIISEKIIAIVRGYTLDQCIKLASALCAGGVHMMEVTFPQEDRKGMEETAERIKALKKELGDRMEFGAGTVTSVEMVKMAHEAGASFIISPNTDESVIKATLENDMVSVPGAFTPTEIKHAYDCGADFVKVFPVNMFGPKYIKTVRAPLSQVRLMAVGGVTEKDINDYFKAGACSAGVAGCLFNKEWIENGNWNLITEAAEKLVKTVEQG